MQCVVTPYEFSSKKKLSLAGLSISEQNHKTELGLRSMTKYKELIDTADILTLPGLLRCEIPELDDWERIKEDAKKWADLEPKDGKLNYSRVSSIRNWLHIYFNNTIM